jgi:hypothetical protein
MFRRDSGWKAHSERSESRVWQDTCRATVRQTSKMVRFERARSNKTEQLHIDKLQS